MMTTDYAGQLHDWMSIYGPDEQLADLNALIADRDAWRAIAERQTRHTDAAVLMVSKLEAERDEAQKDTRVTLAHFDKALARAEAAEARVTELEAALGFYADKKHIVRQGDNGLYILCDFGDEARIALAKEDTDE